MKPVIVSKYYYERVPQSTLIQETSEYKFDVWCCGGMNVGWRMFCFDRRFRKVKRNEKLFHVAKHC